MSLEQFDYGGDDSPARATSPLDELDDLFGTSGAEARRPAAHNSLLAELDVRVMLQVIVAVVLLAVAGGLLARNALARQTRDAAFRQMADANGRHEYLRVIDGAETFLTHPPPGGGRDARQAEVVSLYREALVHCVARQLGKLDADALARVARYKQLVKTADE